MMSDYRESTKCLEDQEKKVTLNAQKTATLNTQKTASPKSVGSEVQVEESEILPSIPSIQLKNGPYIDDLENEKPVVAKLIDMQKIPNAKLKEPVTKVKGVMRNHSEKKLQMKQSSTDLLKNASLDRELKITKSMIMNRHNLKSITYLQQK